MLEFISLSLFFFEGNKKGILACGSHCSFLFPLCVHVHLFLKKNAYAYAIYYLPNFFLADAIYLLNFKPSVLLNHSELGSSSQAVILKLVVNPYRDLNNFFSYIKIFCFRNKTIESTIYYL